MRKSIWMMQSVFLSVFTLSMNDIQSVKANDETTETKPIIETRLLDHKDDEVVISEVLDDLFVDGFSSVIQAKEVENYDPEVTKYTIDHLIVETNIDLDKIGKQSGTITVYDKGSSNVSDSLKLVVQESKAIHDIDKNIKHSFDVEVTIEDRQAPVITLVSDQVWLDYEEEIIPEEWFDHAYDDVDGEITDFIFDGESIDETAPGEYIATYKVSDTSGNIAIKELLVTVKDKPIYTQANTSSSIYDMLELINQTRLSYGLHPYALDTTLGAAAQQRAKEASTYISHYRPNGLSYRSVLDEYGVYYNESSEILTCAGTSASAGLNWWMNSPAHKTYILSSRLTKIGIGFYNGMWSALIIN